MLSTPLIFCIVDQPLRSCAQSVDVVSVADTSSPRATLRSFIESCNATRDLVKDKGYVSRSSPCFQQLGESVIDLRYIPASSSKILGLSRVQRDAQLRDWARLRNTRDLVLIAAATNTHVA